MKNSQATEHVSIEGCLKFLRRGKFPTRGRRRIMATFLQPLMNTTISKTHTNTLSEPSHSIAPDAELKRSKEWYSNPVEW